MHRISNSRMQSNLVYFINFSFHMVLGLHFFIQDMHKAFEIYLFYPPKIEGTFTDNAGRLSIYGENKPACHLDIELF